MKNKDIWDILDNGAEAIDRAVSSGDFQHLEQTIRRTVEVGGQTFRRVTEAVRTPAPPKLYGSTGGRRAGGIIKLALGGILATVGIALIGLWPGLVGLCATGGVLLGAGAVDLALVNRFQIYRRLLGKKTSIRLVELAGGVQKSLGFVKKDLQRMFGAGFFLEGHLDHEQTMLITSHATFEEFETQRLKLEQRRAEAAKVTANPIREILDKGDAFLLEIRRCNDRIPGAEISAKISRMEHLVERIFDRAETNPEVAPDLKKLLEYYLPMTVKLLRAYADMDAQSVQGENITASKREIENTLDTLNTAFEKLLDQLFQDAAWDVSSDISVLNTMLAQEGLTEDELTKMRKTNH